MRLLIIVWIVLALSSCEMATEITVPAPPTTAVINSVFSSDTTWFVSVSTTAPILTNFPSEILNPVVNLTDETGQQIPLTRLERSDVDGVDPNYPNAPFENVGAWYYRGTSNPQPGMTYRIEVSGSNVPLAVATARMPDEVEILEVNLDSTGIDSYYLPEFHMPVEFTFRDPAGQADFYYPSMIFTYEYTWYDPWQADTVTAVSWEPIRLVRTINSDLDFFEGDDQRRVLIPDKLFDGEVHTEKLYAILHSPNSRQNTKAISLKLYLVHRDAEYFEYFRSLALQENARYNPFAEPVQVYSNVLGGLGIFVGSTSSYWECVK